MRRRKQKQSLTKIIGLSAALVGCIASLAYAVIVMPKNTPDQFGCFDAVDAQRTLVFVDASEPRWNEQQQRSLRIYLDKLFDSLEFNEKINFYTTEGDVVSSIFKPRFHVCGQASTPDELDAIGAPSGNAGYLAKQKERLYDKVLGPELDALLAVKPDESRKQLYQSPVLETIKALSRDIRPGDRLVVISDLIQNSDSAQFCRTKNDMPPFKVFVKRSVYQRRLKPQSLEGVQVEVLMLQRYGYAQGELAYCYEDELQKFYEDYLAANGVEASRFTRLREGYAEVSH